MEERRTAYVALTRAKRRLVVTGAHWYGEGQKPKEPSVFFEELAAWAAETGFATVAEPVDVPEENPLAGYRERFVRDWPGPARRDRADEVFPDGWRQTAMAVASEPARLDAMVASLLPEERKDYERRSAELRTVAANLLERRADASGGGPSLPASVSVGGIIEYARCPKRFYWSFVRPLPRFSGPAARIGTQVHAWIERKSSGQTSLLELDERPDLTAEELAGAPGKVERLQRTFTESRFATAPPLFAERPFLLHVEGFTVSGRIDAIFGEVDGPWEVVDYKTGSKPPADDVLSGLQLDVYALACTEVWDKRPEDLTLTYFYLASGEQVTRPAGDPAETRARVAAAFRGVAERRFEPEPGPQCRWCDFLPFCDAGKAFMASRV